MYKCAFLGCGPRARGHAKAYADVKRGKIAAICDMDEKRLNEFGNEFGVAVRYTDIHDPGYSMVFCDEKDYRSNSNMGTFAQDPRCWGTNHWVDYVANFHDNGDNYGFADGHAEWWKWMDQRTLDGSKAQQFYWPDNGNTDLERIRKAYFNEMPGAW